MVGEAIVGTMEPVEMDSSLDSLLHGDRKTIETMVAGGALTNIVLGWVSFVTFTKNAPMPFGVGPCQEQGSDFIRVPLSMQWGKGCEGHK